MKIKCLSEQVEIRRRDSDVKEFQSTKGKILHFVQHDKKVTLSEAKNLINYE